MDVTLSMFLIVCPVCFLAGIMNSSCGGGGLISLPALLLAGLPAHMAIGTNKLQAICGLAVANIRYARKGFLNAKLALFTIAFAIVGSLIGSHISLLCNETLLTYFIVFVIPFVAFFTFRKNVLTDGNEDDLRPTPKLIATCCAIALCIGTYDGFYGPGSGTFLVLALSGIAHLDVRHASAHAKIVNLTTNVIATGVFLANGQVMVLLGLAGGLCNIAGAFIGSELIIQKGSFAMKPLIALAFVLLVLKLVIGF